MENNQAKKQEDKAFPARKFSRPNVARKQKKVLDLMVKNGSSVTEAIRESGEYSESIAQVPSKITDSKTWQELIDVYLPDDILARNHQELLDQKKIEYFVFSKKMEDEEIKSHVTSAGLTLIVIRESDKGKLAFYSISDAQAKKAALEMAYKLKGKMSDEKPVSPHGNTYNFIFSGPVQERVKLIEGDIKKLLIQPKKDENAS